MASGATTLPGAAPAYDRHRSRWPARLELVQSLTGLMLVVFVWCHMLLDASILVSEDMMYRVSRFMEGRYLFGADHPLLVTVAAGAILAIIIIHAVVALRKFPARYAEYHAFSDHMARFRHDDTVLWWLQVWTGFAMLFLSSAHLIGVMTHPADIGPYASSDRIVGQWMWTVYAPLLIAVHVHAGLGIYRLAVKWGFTLGRDAEASRHRLKRVRWVIIGFFLVLGFASLVAYMTIGIAHQGRAGERYVPTWERNAIQRWSWASGLAQPFPLNQVGVRQ